MGDQYWVTASCNGAPKNKMKPHTQLVDAGESFSFDGEWSHVGFVASLDCQVCFDKYGSSEPPQCVSAGSLPLEPLCTCATIKSSKTLQTSTTCPAGKKAVFVSNTGVERCYECVDEDDECADCNLSATADCPSGYKSVSQQCGTASCYKCEVDPDCEQSDDCKDNTNTPCEDAGYSATNVTGYCTAVQHTYTPAATAAAPNPDPVTVTCYDCSTPDCMTNHGQFDAGYVCPPPGSPDLTQATNHPHFDKNNQLYYCVTCDYPPPPAASFAPVGPMGSMAFTG